MTAVLLPNGKQQYFTTAGLPAVGYKVATFDAGTSNPRLTWLDAGKISANTNPIILDGRGEASIFWEGAYKVQLQDSTGAVIWTQDNLQSQQNSFSVTLVPATNNTVDLGSNTLAWRNIYVGANNAAILDTTTGNIGYYARTATEIAAAITPTNFSYAPGDVRRYGADSTGVADCSASITSAMACNAQVTFGNAGSATYRVSTNLTLARGKTFTFDSGSILSVDTGKKISLDTTAIVAGSYQIFGGVGLVQNTADYTHGPGRYNAKWWGAVGDGVNNDDLPLQAAIDAVDQGVLYIPEGQYKIRAAHPLVKTFPGTSIEGDGYYTDIHGVGFAGSSPILTIDGTVTAHTNMFVRRLQFSCDNVAAAGLSVKYVNKCKFEEIAFQSMSQGILCGSHVFSCTFIQVGTSGGTAGLTFSVNSDSYNNNAHINCFFGGLGFTLTATGYCASNSFISCDSEANNNVGLGAMYFVTSGGSGVIAGTAIVNCHFENNNSAAMYFNGAATANSIRGISITGCNIGGGFADGPHPSAGSGIVLQNCNGVHIAGNYIDDFGNYAINDASGNSNWNVCANYATRCLTAFSNTGLIDRFVMPYSASMTIDASVADWFSITATNAVAFTINAPINPQGLRSLRVTIRNTSGGALGVATWNAIFKLAAWVQPATGQSRTIEFLYDGTNWIEQSRTPNDVPN